MQNTTTAAEKKAAILAAREARLEAERQRVEEERVREAAEAVELAELERVEEEEKKAKAEAERKANEEAKRKAEEAKAKEAEERVLRLVTPADEESLVEALKRQGVEVSSLGLAVAGSSREGAERCWECRRRNKVCERRENKR
jgi:hypothetical protein